MSPPPVPKDSSAHSVPPIELEPSSSQANQTLPSGPASSPMMVHSPASDIKSGHRCRAAGEPRSAGGAKMSASAVEARTSISPATRTTKRSEVWTKRSDWRVMIAAAKPSAQLPHELRRKFRDLREASTRGGAHHASSHGDASPHRGPTASCHLRLHLPRRHRPPRLSRRHPVCCHPHGHGPPLTRAT